MKCIQLNRGEVAIVSDEDFEKIAQYRWFCQVATDGLKYASRSVNFKDSEGKRTCRSIQMHHMILPKKDGFRVDHRNRNGLDNRRENLRYATNRQNRANSKVNKDNRAGLKGVSYRPEKSKCNPWYAAIATGIKNKKRHLGCFPTSEQAHAAYCAAATKEYGEFARFN